MIILSVVTSKGPAGLPPSGPLLIVSPEIKWESHANGRTKERYLKEYPPSAVRKVPQKEDHKLIQSENKATMNIRAHYSQIISNRIQKDEEEGTQPALRADLGLRRSTYPTGFNALAWFSLKQRSSNAAQAAQVQRSVLRSRGKKTQTENDRGESHRGSKMLTHKFVKRLTRVKKCSRMRFMENLPRKDMLTQEILEDAHAERKMLTQENFE